MTYGNHDDELLGSLAAGRVTDWIHHVPTKVKLPRVCSSQGLSMVGGMGPF